MSPDADLTVRILALAQLAVLLGCGLGWHLTHRDRIPTQAWFVGWGYGYALVVVVVAVTVNMVLAETITAGQIALTIGLVPATAWVVAHTVVLITRAARHARAVLAWLDRLDDLEPCPTPDCVTVRDEARELVKRALPRRSSKT